MYKLTAVKTFVVSLLEAAKATWLTDLANSFAFTSTASEVKSKEMYGYSFEGTVLSLKEVLPSSIANNESSIQSILMFSPVNLLIISKTLFGTKHSPVAVYSNTFSPYSFVVSIESKIVVSPFDAKISNFSLLRLNL